MVNPPRIPRGSVRERRLAQFVTSPKLVLEKFTQTPDTRPEGSDVGRVIYTTDTNEVQVFNGSNWVVL